MTPDQMVFGVIGIMLTILIAAVGGTFALMVYFSKSIGRVHTRLDQMVAADSHNTTEIAVLRGQHDELRRDVDAHIAHPCHDGRRPACDS